MSENVIDIVVRAKTEIENIRDAINLMENLKDIPEGLQESFEDLHVMPEGLSSIYEEQKKILEELTEARKIGDQESQKVHESELHAINRQIEGWKELVKLKRDSYTTGINEFVDKAEFNIDDPHFFAMVQEGAEEHRKALLAAANFMQADSRSAIEQSKTERSISSDDITGGGGAGAVGWSVMQTVKDHITRSIIDGIQEGFGAMGNSVSHRALGFGVGGIGEVVSGIFGTADEADQNFRTTHNLMSRLGLFRNRGAQGSHGREWIDNTKKQILDFANEYGMTFGQATGGLDEVSGYAASGEMGLQKTMDAMRPLMALRKLGVSSDIIFNSGDLATYLTGGTGAGKEGQIGWMSHVYRTLADTGYGGGNIEQILQNYIEPLAHKAGSISGIMTGEDLRNSMWGLDAFRGTSYQSFMHDNPHELMRFQSQISDAFANTDNDSMRSFLMRAYDYKGGSLDEFAKFKLRSQQGFVGKGGFENFKAVFEQLSNELPDAQDPTTMAMVLSDITGVPMAQLVPLVEKMKAGTLTSEGFSKETISEKDMETAAKSVVSEKQVIDAKRASTTEELGTKLDKIIDQLAELLQDIAVDLMPYISKGIEVLQKSIDWFDNMTGKSGQEKAMQRLDLAEEKARKTIRNILSKSPQDYTKAEANFIQKMNSGKLTKSDVDDVMDSKTFKGLLPFEKTPILKNIVIDYNKSMSPADQIRKALEENKPLFQSGGDFQPWRDIFFDQSKSREKRIEEFRSQFNLLGFDKENMQPGINPLQYGNNSGNTVNVIIHGDFDYSVWKDFEYLVEDRIIEMVFGPVPRNDATKPIGNESQ